MTPAARLATAAELLDDILGGQPAERVLTRWARGARYAGSRDRQAIRDVVFDCIRRRRSLAHRAGAETGRALVLAHQASEGADLDTLFTGERFAPAPLTDAERHRLATAGPGGSLPIAFDFPDFLEPELRRSLGVGLPHIMAAMQSRAPVDLRVNALKATRRAAADALAAEGVETHPLDLAPWALRAVTGGRKVAQTAAYADGLVELQDVSSQAVAQFAAPPARGEILDYCAGGGGKALALAAMAPEARIVAHDAAPDRMRDLPARAARGGARIQTWPPAKLAAWPGGFDLVLVDAPCSGTGAWRRQPDAKWRLTPGDIDRLADLQDRILMEARARVRPGGVLVYATCSLLHRENRARIDAALARDPGLRLLGDRRLTPLDGGDGFYVARLSVDG